MRRIWLGVGPPALSGVSATDTGPLTRQQHAMRVLSAWPRRSSVERSSSETGERLPIPSLTAIGSAPQTPMRQPASIVWPFASAISSTVAPGLATTRVPSATKVTSGAPDRSERERASERPAAADSPPARAAASAWNCASFWNVRRTQAAVSASTATCIAHVTASGDGSPVSDAHERRARRTSRRC